MVENIKITARELKRQLKLSIYLPKNYNNNESYYPLIYALDGQIMFYSIDNNEQKIDLPSILDSSSKECICIGIHSPKIPEWRISELCPYYKRDDSQVDPDLAINLMEYIINILHPLLKQRYRINDNIYLLGFNEGAIFNLYATYHYDFFKGSGVFSPALEICENVLDDIKANYSPDKRIYLYQGGNNCNNTNLFYSLYTQLEDLKCDKLKLIYEEAEENNSSFWQTHILDFLNFILE